MMYSHEAECLAENLVHYLQGQGHSKGLYNWNMTVSTIYYKPLVHLQPNLCDFVWVLLICMKNWDESVSW